MVDSICAAFNHAHQKQPVTHARIALQADRANAGNRSAPHQEVRGNEAPLQRVQTGVDVDDSLIPRGWRGRRAASAKSIFTVKILYR